MRKLSIFAILVAVAFTSCEPQNEDVVQKPNRDGDVEVNVSTSQYKDSTILTVHYTAFNKNAVVSDRVVVDTLPGLGTTVTEGEDADGNTQTLTVPKQYEFYVTVK